MPVTIYESTNPSAPVLSGTLGSLVALLDACLVNGYGTKGAAGWTKAFSGTNKAAYLQGAKADRLQFYLRVQDDAPGAQGEREARMRGYEAMTDVDTGTGLSPTAAQLAAGIICRKSTTLDATARAWLLAADHRTAALFVTGGGTAKFVWYFGDIVSRVPADQYAVQIIGRIVENGDDPAGDRFGDLASGLTVISGHYVARALPGTGTSLNNGKHSDTPKAAGVAVMGGGGSGYPDPAGGKLLMARVDVHDAGAAPAWRGWLRGFWNPLHSYVNFQDGDTFSGGGRTYRVLRKIYYSGGTEGCVALETSNTWDTD